MLKLTTWLNKKRYTLLWSLFLLLPCLCISAQEPLSHLTIDEVYQMARANYPLVKQKGLISKTKEYAVSNASKGYLPAFSINGQATYQSDVTSFPFKIPIPGFTLPSYSKDQYKVYGELDQVIYDGGLIKNQQQTAETNEMVQQQNLEVSLYSLYDRLDQLYFGILLVKQQLLQNKILQKDIQNGIDKAKALVANGTAYRSSVDELSAQLLQAEQSAVEITATQKAYLDMLGLFINKKLDTDTELEKPVSPPITETINRPEVFYYDFQKKTLDLQDQLLKTQLRPKFSLYLQGGYGRPGLNMLNNDFAFFGIAHFSIDTGTFYIGFVKKGAADAKTAVVLSPDATGESYFPFSFQATYDLGAGSEIAVQLEPGVGGNSGSSLRGNSEHYTYFTGYLLEQDWS